MRMMKSHPSNEALMTRIVCSSSIRVEQTILLPLTKAKVLPIYKGKKVRQMMLI